MALLKDMQRSLHKNEPERLEGEFGGEHKGGYGEKEGRGKQI